MKRHMRFIAAMGAFAAGGVVALGLGGCFGGDFEVKRLEGLRRAGAARPG